MPAELNFLWYSLFAIVIFFATLIGYKRFFSTALYALAIGGVVNSNYWHTGIAPINIGGLYFGIDSIIYTLFVFCVILMYLESGKFQAYLLAGSSSVAIIISAIFQFVASVLSNGFTFAYLNEFMSFLISVVATIAAIIPMIEVIHLLKKKDVNNFVLIIVGTLIATVINSTLYYLISPNTYMQKPDDVYQSLFTSYLGKILALGCSILVYSVKISIDEHIEKKKIKKESEDK